MRCSIYGVYRRPRPMGNQQNQSAFSTHITRETRRSQHTHGLTWSGSYKNCLKHEYTLVGKPGMQVGNSPSVMKQVDSNEGWKIPNLREMLIRIGSRQPKCFWITELSQRFYQMPLHFSSFIERNKNGLEYQWDFYLLTTSSRRL